MDLINDYHQSNYKVEKVNNKIREDNKDLPASEKERLIRRRSGASLIRELKEKELSYSEGSIYHDLRRNASFFKSKTSEAENRAQDWFDNYFEPFRKSKRLTARQAHELWIAAKTQSYDHLTRAELEFALELREIGSP